MPLVIPIRSVIVFLVATLSTAVVVEFWFSEHGYGTFSLGRTTTFGNGSISSVPTFAIYQRSQSEDHLRHVFKLFEYFGYKRVGFDDEWDLLWAHDYPFLRMPQRMRNLRPHQVVNHFPGCGFITNKVDLSTTRLPFLPRAFRLPEQSEAFLEYAHDHPNALFVEKHNEHRSIVIRSPVDVNLSSSDFFVQEFVQNPFLVDGYKFDMGVYVVVTSIDPMLVYIYTGDVLFRYCPVKYHPFDRDNVDKYVVGDDYLPTWEVPSLKKYYSQFSGSMRAAFDAYVHDQSLDASVIWQQVEDIVRHTVTAKQQNIANILRNYKFGKFFELLRVDLIVDDQLRVHLMEVNMSPNLSSAHFKPNALLYDQILYSVFNLVGIAGQRNLKTSVNDADEEIITAEKNLATDLNRCVRHYCDKSCNTASCILCLPCLSGTEYSTLRQAHQEHIHKTDMKRILPKPINNPEEFNIEIEVQNLTKRNELLVRWFYGKCLYERSWCF